MKCFLIGLATLAASASAAEARFDARPLDRPDGANAVATRINAAGQVLGRYVFSAQPVPAQSFLTGPDGVGFVDPCAVAGFVNCLVDDIDDQDDVLVEADFTDGQGQVSRRQVLMKQDGTGQVTPGTLGPRTTTYYGLSPHGLAVGQDGNGRAFATRQGLQKLHEIATFGGNAGAATAVNDSGVVGGSSLLPDNTNWHAFLALPDGSPPRDLGTFRQPGDPHCGDCDQSYVGAINAAGLVVGSAATSAAYGGAYWVHAFLARADAPGLVDLGTLGQRQGSQARGINRQGTIVGNSYNFSEGGSRPISRRVFIGRASDARIHDLNDDVAMPAGVVLGEYPVINDRGLIAATGSDGKVYLLTPR